MQHDRTRFQAWTPRSAGRLLNSAPFREFGTSLTAGLRRDDTPHAATLKLGHHHVPSVTLMADDRKLRGHTSCPVLADLPLPKAGQSWRQGGQSRVGQPCTSFRAVSLRVLWELVLRTGQDSITSFPRETAGIWEP